MPADAAFGVMGATAEVTVVGGPRALLEVARGRLTDLERRWSRFVPTSEVSRLNRAQGLPVRVSSETRLLVRRALDGYAVTNGRFDPTLLGAVLRAGYVESFDRLGSRPRPTTSRGPQISAARSPDRNRRASGSGLVTGAHRIEVDDRAGTVRIPLGVGFDPGGIGKGLAADLVTEELLALGAAGACVNVGGDVRVCGAAPDDAAWHVAVDSPWDGSAPLAELHLHDGAVATSSRLRRRWVDDAGAEQHHLVDPATGASARSPVLAATAVASLGWQAEVLAKAAFLDAAQGLDLVDRLGAAAVVVVPDGLLTSPGWPTLTGAARTETIA